MRALLTIILALGTIWGGYWVVGSIALKSAAEAWFAQQTQQGFEARYGDLAVDGFPNRFDLTVTDLHLADPGAGFSWDAPFAQVFSMTWKPWHLIAALPNSQTVTTPDGVIKLGSAAMKGSLVMVPGTALALDAVVVEGVDLAATSTRGWGIKMARAQLATRQDASLANGHQMTLTLTGLTPDPAVTAGVPDLPAVIDTALIDLVAGFSAPIDRFAANSKPQVTAVTLKQALVRWGDVQLSLTGAVVADADGLAEGRIDIKLASWRKVLPVAVTMGLFTAEVAPTVENMMALMAQQSGDGTVLDLPLVMKDGRMSLGPLPIGAAPRMLNGPQG